MAIGGIEKITFISPRLLNQSTSYSAEATQSQSIRLDRKLTIIVNNPDWKRSAQINVTTWKHYLKWGICIDFKDVQPWTAFTSIRLGFEPDSYVNDESELHPEKHTSQRIWAVTGMRLSLELDSNVNDESSIQRADMDARGNRYGLQGITTMKYIRFNSS
jgi:hypothetical protein